MDSTEEELSTFTTKGRRTKRQRSSSTYRDCGGAGGGSDNSYHGSSTSASPSDEHDVMSEVTTEEEDMANCLILLAQGIHNKVKGPNNNVTKRPNNNNNIAGVYECKTCNKTFPSFQALGGHRTSHKKIKPPSSTTVPSPDHHEDHRDAVVDLDVMELSSAKKIIIPTQSSHHDDNNNKGRVHECSICGSEFPSGQALGGHMRRHRAVLPPSTVSPGRLMMSSEAAATVVIDTGGPRNILSLDLNLPAPDDQDDDQVCDDMSTKFVHVLPRPAPLVDCYY